MRFLKLIYWILFVPIVPVGAALLLIAWFGDDTYQGEEARQAAADQQIKNFIIALGRYKLDTGVFPEPAEGLQALRDNPGNARWQGPYLQMDIPHDPWGHPYVYTIGPDGKPEIRSLGLDTIPSPHRSILLGRIGWLLAGVFGAIVYPLLPRLWRRLR